MGSSNYPPIKPGTRIRTTAPNMDMRDEWTLAAWEKKRWGVGGVIVTHHDSHGLCYDVLHDDGTEASYDPSEFELE